MGQLSFESLRDLFHELVEKNYSALGLRDEAITGYVSALLDDFKRTSQLYRVHSTTGEPLGTVGEMLFEAGPLSGGELDRACEIRRHVADFALFFTGMFPESLNDGIRARRLRGENLFTYVQTGKESYQFVSDVQQQRRGDNDCYPELFARLAKEFERCMYGLNLVKSELESFRGPIYQEVKRLVM